MTKICYHCFADRGDCDVCPICGYISLPAGQGYVLRPETIIAERYMIGAVIGMGGFGIIYKALDLQTNSVVAIKEFFPRLFVSRIPGEDEVKVVLKEKEIVYNKELNRFLHECAILSMFTEEPYIVRAMEYFQLNGTAYLAMEYLEGQTLKLHMEETGEKIPIETAIEYEEQILKALIAMHENQVIHRDISPDNIFLQKNGGLKIIDFGSARFLQEDGIVVSQGIAVKKGYAPPEQYRTDQKQGEWTDIYAVGAVFYKMITGVTPCGSTSRLRRDILAKPSQLSNEIGRTMDRFVMKSMEIKPRKRFATCREMIGDVVFRRKPPSPMKTSLSLLTFWRK